MSNERYFAYENHKKTDVFHTKSWIFGGFFVDSLHLDEFVDFVEDMIKKLVFTTSGFDVVNRAVKCRLSSWLTDQFRNYVDVAAEAIISQRSEGSQQTGLTH